jgi:hypothetical protein
VNGICSSRMGKGKRIKISTGNLKGRPTSKTYIDVGGKNCSVNQSNKIGRCVKEICLIQDAAKAVN